MLAILTAFGAGAIMLDRLYPMSEDEEEADVQGPPSGKKDESPLERHVGISETG
jgi:hypothetical protein